MLQIAFRAILRPLPVPGVAECRSVEVLVMATQVGAVSEISSHLGRAPRQ